MREREPVQELITRVGEGGQRKDPQAAGSPLSRHPRRGWIPPDLSPRPVLNRLGATQGEILKNKANQLVFWYLVSFIEDHSHAFPRR